MPSANFSAGGVTRKFERALAGAVLPLQMLPGQAPVLPVYTAQVSATPERNYKILWSERASETQKVNPTGSDFQKQFSEFASITERNLSLLQGQVVDLAQQIGDLARTSSINEGVGDAAWPTLPPKTDEDWAVVFHLAADEGADVTSGAEEKALEILRQGGDSALLLAAARALAVLSASVAREAIIEAISTAKNPKVADRLSTILEDYDL